VPARHRAAEEAAVTSHDELAELLGAYALDAVEEDEARAVEEHLADCPRCRAEVAQHREVAAMLGNAGGVAPDAVWERIAAELSLEQSGVPSDPVDPARVAALRAEHDDAGAVVGRAAIQAATLARDSAGLAAPDGRRTSSSTRRRRLAPAAVAGLTALAAALAIVVGVLTARVDDLDHQVSQVQSALSSSSLAGAALAVSLDPANPRAELSPAPVKPAAPPSAQLVVDRRTGTAFFVATGLAPLPGDRTYQLWSLVRGELVSVALLGPRPSTAQPAELEVQPDMSRFMVTAEPEGGTAQPTTPVLIQGTLAAAS
jgi:predicted anti-sigma-YlaC factor YlaD